MRPSDHRARVQREVARDLRRRGAHLDAHLRLLHRRGPSGRGDGQHVRPPPEPEQAVGPARVGERRGLAAEPVARLRGGDGRPRQRPAVVAAHRARDDAPRRERDVDDERLAADDLLRGLRVVALPRGPVARRADLQEDERPGDHVLERVASRRVGHRRDGGGARADEPGDREDLGLRERRAALRVGHHAFEPPARRRARGRGGWTPRATTIFPSGARSRRCASRK